MHDKENWPDLFSISMSIFWALIAMLIVLGVEYDIDFVLAGMCFALSAIYIKLANIR